MVNLGGGWWTLVPPLLGKRLNCPFIQWRYKMHSHKYTALKTVTWRLLASADTLLISYLLTGSFAIAGTIASLEVVTKMFLYYGHERFYEWLDRKK